MVYSFRPFLRLWVLGCVFGACCVMQIILAVDADGPGMVLAEELARRLCRTRCRRVVWPKSWDDHLAMPGVTAASLYARQMRAIQQVRCAATSKTLVLFENELDKHTVCTRARCGQSSRCAATSFA